MRFVAGRGAVAKRLVRGAAVAERHRENVASRGAVAEALTPNEVCCWQDSRWETHRESKIGEDNRGR